MDNRFDFLAEEMLDNALKDFRATEQHRLQKERLEQMERDCQSMFTQDEQAFAEECFEVLLDVEESKTQYAYHRGLLDSVRLLKWLGVLV